MRTTALGSTVAENSIRFLGHAEHEHDQPHVVYVVSGSAVLTVDGVDLPLRTHEAAWLQAHVPHAVRVRDGGMLLGPMLEGHVAPSVRVVLLGQVPALIDVMTTSMVAAPASMDEVLPFRRALGRVLLNASRPYFRIAWPEHPAARRLAGAALTGTAPLDRLAHEHRMSTRQVQRVFLAETGLSFSRWRTRARLNPAIAHLLGGGDLDAAAQRAGFSTRAGLLKALSRESGLSLETLREDPAEALSTDAVTLG